MNNINIICIADGLTITRNTQYLEQQETVFAFNSVENYIHTFTYPLYINIIDTNKWTTIINMNISENNIINIDKGFLFYSYDYQLSFCHYLHETIPKLTDYLTKYKNFKILIPEHCHHLLSKNIIKLCNIPEEQIVLLKDKTIYNVKQLEQGIQTPHASMYTQHHLWIYNHLRTMLNVTNNMPKIRKIYFKKDGVSDSKYGNVEAGIYRRILNEDALCDELVKHGFEIVTLGTKTLEEKNNALKDAKIIITQLGANCANFYFTNAPKHVIYLTNNSCRINEGLYIEIASKLNNIHIPYTTLAFPDNKSNIDPLNNTNCPFIVDINHVVNTAKLHM